MLCWQIQNHFIRYAQDQVNQEESENNDVDGVKKGADSTDEVMHI